MSTSGVAPGPWKTRGHIFDELEASPARNSEAWRFGKKYFGASMATFSLEKFGETGSQVLAMAWCRRREYFFDLWKGQGKEAYHFTQAAVEGSPRVSRVCVVAL